MKTTAYTNLFSPLYVLLSGSLGFIIALAIFTWNYPAPGDKAGQAFVSTQPFYIWIFLFAVLCCVLTIFILPLWGMLFGLLQNRIITEDQELKPKLGMMLLGEGLLLTIAIFSLLQFMNSTPINTDLGKYVPQGHSDRMFFMYIYTYATALPALLGMFLIHAAAGKLSAQIEAAGNADAKLFPLIADLLHFRTILQSYLAILGIILSMIPITTAGLRAIILALNPEDQQIFPITNAILFGLVFTILLLLIYVPTHFALTEVSRKLRDQLRPLAHLATLPSDMEERKALDELLQTNIGITQNLKTGLITLAPLATSLLTSLLNINIPL